MSDSTVNPQITDAVTQSNVKVVGEAPAMAMGMIYQSIAQATGILFQNAVAAQQQQAIAAQAATNQGIMQIYSVDTASAAGATAGIDAPPHQALLLRAQQATDAARVSSPSGLSDVPLDRRWSRSARRITSSAPSARRRVTCPGPSATSSPVACRPSARSAM